MRQSPGASTGVRVGRNGEAREVAVRVFWNGPNDTPHFSGMVAFRHHMRLMMHKCVNKIAKLRDWATCITKVSEYDMVGRSNFRDANPKEPLARTYPCAVFRKLSEIPVDLFAYLGRVAMEKSTHSDPRDSLDENHRPGIDCGYWAQQSRRHTHAGNLHAFSSNSIERRTGVIREAFSRSQPHSAGSPVPYLERLPPPSAAPLSFCTSMSDNRSGVVEEVPPNGWDTP